MFESLNEKFENVFQKLRGQKSLTEDNIKEAVREVRMALLEADVNYLIVKEFIKDIREEAIGQEIVKGVDPAQQLFSIVQKGLVRMMAGDPETDIAFEVEPGRKQIVLMLGLQGAGKTTFCGKLANFIREQKARPMLVRIARPASPPARSTWPSKDGIRRHT